MTQRKRRLLAAVNRLALRPLHTASARLNAECTFCTLAIRAGDAYRSAGSLKAHEPCFRALAQEIKSWR
jgi:hypothetical protein